MCQRDGTQQHEAAAQHPYTTFSDGDFEGDGCSADATPPPPPHGKPPARCATPATAQAGGNPLKPGAVTPPPPLGDGCSEDDDPNDLNGALLSATARSAHSLVESLHSISNTRTAQPTVPGGTSYEMLEVSRIGSDDPATPTADPGGETPFPLVRFAALAVVLMTNSVFITSLFPFLKFYVVDLGISEKDSGLYVGLIAAGFMIGRAISSIWWGRFADTRGRRPAIMISLASTMIFAPLFGLPYNVWASFAIRFAAGFTNCLIGIGKVLACEIAPPEHQARAMSVVSVAWGSGNIFGPAFGGWLSGWDIPVPYLPPMMLSCLLACVGLFLTWAVLPETLDLEKLASLRLASTSELINHKALRISLALYCVWSLQSIAAIELFNMWGSTDVALGGLGLTSAELGTVQSICGAFVLAMQLLVLPPLSKRLGLKRLCTMCITLYLPVQAAMPFLRLLPGVAEELPEGSNITALGDAVGNATGGFAEPSAGEKAVLMGVSVVVLCGVQAMSSFAFTLQFMFINNAVRSHNRASAQGMAMSFASVFKSIGPFLIGVIYSWSISEERPFPIWYAFGWICLCFSTCIALFLTRLLPESINKAPLEGDDAGSHV